MSIRDTAIDIIRYVVENGTLVLDARSVSAMENLETIKSQSRPKGKRDRTGYYVVTVNSATNLIEDIDFDDGRATTSVKFTGVATRVTGSGLARSVGYQVTGDIYAYESLSDILTELAASIVVDF